MKQALKAVLKKDVAKLKELVGGNKSILQQVIAELDNTTGKSDADQLYETTNALLELIKDDRAVLEGVLNAPDDLGVTPLSKALELGQIGMVKALLRYPSTNVTQENWIAISNLPGPWEAAIDKYLAKHKATLITELVESKRAVSVEDLDALLAGDITPFKYCSRETLEALKETEYLPLKDFIKSNDEQLDKLIRTLDGILGNTTNKAIALQNKNKIEVAREIIDEGLWLNGDADLITTIISFGSETLINALKARYDEVTPRYLGLAVLQALEFRLVASVKPLIDAGADVNVRDATGYTPLMWAVYMNNKEAVQQLVESGAKLDEIMLTGNTSLMFAVAGGYQDIVDILLKAGADANLRNISAESPLTLAIKHKHTGIIEALVANGAGFDERTLSIAVNENNVEAVKILLLNGADPHKAGVVDHIKLEGKTGRESWSWGATRGNAEVKEAINQYLELEKNFKKDFESKIVEGIESNAITINNIEAKVDDIIDEAQPTGKKIASEPVKAQPEEHRKPEGLSFFKLLVILIMRYFFGSKTPTAEQKAPVDKALAKLSDAVEGQQEFKDLSQEKAGKFADKISTESSKASGRE